MGEKIDTVFFFANARNLPSHHALVEMFLVKFPLWLGRTHDWLLLDYEQGRQSQGEYSGSDVLSRPLSRSEILFLYSSPDDSARRLNSLSIQEQDNLAVYTVSIEVNQILPHSVRLFEDWLVTMFQAVKPLGISVIFAGSEFGWEEEWSTAATVQEQAFLSNTASYWIVIDKQALPLNYEEFEIVHSFDTFYLLRRKTF